MLLLVVHLSEAAGASVLKGSWLNNDLAEHLAGIERHVSSGAELRWGVRVVAMARVVDNGHEDPGASTVVQLAVGEAHTLALTGAFCCCRL